MAYNECDTDTPRVGAGTKGNADGDDEGSGRGRRRVHRHGLPSAQRQGPWTHQTGNRPEIKRIAKDLGYRPNLVARNLKTRSSRILGFISDEIATTPFAGRIMLGAQDAARELGYILLTVNTGNDPDLERRQIGIVRQYGADGFLYAMMYHRKVDVPEQLDDLPVVLVDAEDRAGARPSICPDEYGIGYTATRRLLDAGCRRIAYFGADVPIVAQSERLAGYRAALDESPIGYDDRLVLAIDEHDVYGDVPRLFDECRPDGVFCFNDVRAHLGLP